MKLLNLTDWYQSTPVAVACKNLHLRQYSVVCFAFSDAENW